MQHKKLNFWQRLRFRLGRKTQLDEGIAYKYYAMKIKGQPTVVQEDPHSDKTAI